MTDGLGLRSFDATNLENLEQLKTPLLEQISNRIQLPESKLPIILICLIRYTPQVMRSPTTSSMTLLWHTIMAPLWLHTLALVRLSPPPLKLTPLCLHRHLSSLEWAVPIA
jgi:hypothetical protein